MKISKCPFCGKEPETRFYSKEKSHPKLWISGCPECDLFLGPTAASQKISQEDWNNLIAKFPPIMRVQAGDKILYNSCDDDYLAKVNDMCRDKNNDVYLKVVILDSGDEDDVEAHQIIRWPWELEQKGEQEQ